MFVIDENLHALKSSGLAEAFGGAVIASRYTASDASLVQMCSLLVAARTQEPIVLGSPAARRFSNHVKRGPPHGRDGASGLALSV